MKGIHLGMRLKAGIGFTLVLLAAGLVPDSASSSPQNRACTAPEYRQFDFWVGDWDAYDLDNPNTLEARVRVERILDGCALLEDYQGANGAHGQSFSIYDAVRKQWHQSWVTNRGVLLLLDGRFADNEMVLKAHDQTADGKEKLIRGSWKRAGRGVRETAVTSLDDGKTWSPWFDLMFRPHKP